MGFDPMSKGSHRGEANGKMIPFAAGEGWLVGAGVGAGQEWMQTHCQESPLRSWRERTVDRPRVTEWKWRQVEVFKTKKHGLWVWKGTEVSRSFFTQRGAGFLLIGSPRQTPCATKPSNGPTVRGSPGVAGGLSVQRLWTSCPLASRASDFAVRAQVRQTWAP